MTSTDAHLCPACGAMLTPNERIMGTASVLADVATVLVSIEDGHGVPERPMDRLSPGWQRLLRRIATLDAERARAETQALIDENRRLLVERDALLAALGAYRKQP